MSSIAVSRLPSDLVVEILIRLPVKSLLRLKVVCKNWYALIKSPNFISMHAMAAPSQLLVRRLLSREHNAANNMLSIHSNDKSLTLLSQQPPITQFHIAASSNGIIACLDNSSPPNIFLFNPSTREFRHLPPYCIPSHEYISQTLLGFSFNPSNIFDFKVIRILIVKNRRKPTRFVAEIFTKSSNNWMQLDYDQTYSISHNNWDMFYANSCHWPATARHSWESWQEEYVIICFNMLTDNFNKIGVPQFDFSHSEMTLGVLKDSLSLISYHIFTQQGPINIWIMKEYQVVESWTKLFTVLPHLGFHCPLSLKINEHALLSEEKGQLIWLDLHTGDVERLGIYGRSGAMQVMVHKETLVSLY